jgi:hypothetical protein
MLDVPPYGFARSVTKHNGLAGIQADWIEGSVLFAVDSISRADIVDALVENNSYSNQDFASEWTGVVFAEIERRIKLLGAGSILGREGNRIRRLREWQECPAFAFCLVLSLQALYRKQIETACGLDYSQQGALFERLCAESLRALDWEVAVVGWSKDSAETAFETKVSDLASALGSAPLLAGIAKWTPESTKDAGLDLVAWKGFPDGHEGRPICLVQCASGEDWPNKLHTPNLATWNKLIDFATKPRSGLAMPFAPDVAEFRLKANHETLMLLLDRHRLLHPARGGMKFPSKVLGEELIPWVTKRADALPRDTK